MMKAPAGKAVVICGALFALACGLRREGEALPGAILGEWTTEGGEGPTVMALRLTASGPTVQARMRLSGVERHGEGTCGGEGCTLRFPGERPGAGRLEVIPDPAGRSLRITVFDGSGSDPHRYLLVRPAAQ